MNKEVYINTLESASLPFVDEEMGDSWTFMQDGAPAHRALMTTQWFEEEAIHVMDWPAKSPDVNLIENVWGILAWMVYAHQRQFQNLIELRKSVLEAWDEISPAELENLVGSMQRRFLDCCFAKGGPTKY